jgi:hypothetical protein
MLIGWPYFVKCLSAVPVQVVRTVRPSQPMAEAREEKAFWVSFLPTAFSTAGMVCPALLCSGLRKPQPPALDLDDTSLTHADLSTRPQLAHSGMANALHTPLTA